MLLDLPTTIQGTTVSRRSIAYHHNMVRTEAGIYANRVGIKLTANYDNGSNPTTTNAHIPRGQVLDREEEKIYCIFGEKLYYSTGLGAGGLTAVADIDMPALASPAPEDKLNASFAKSYTAIAIATGSKNYILTPSTDTLTEIIDPDLPAARSVVFLDGYFVWCAADGEAVHWSDVNDPTNVGAFSFFDAESRPDKNKELLVLGNDLFVFGERSIERFRSTGNVDAPFIRVSNSIISVGYVGGLIQKGDTALFIGKSENSKYEIFELSRSSIRVLSYGIVSEILNYSYVVKFVGGRSLASCRAQTYVDKGTSVNTFWLNSGYGTGSLYVDICLTCVINSDGSVSWGTYSDNPENGDDGLVSYRDWGEDPFLKINSSIGHMGFGWVNAVEFNGYWHFQRESSLDGAGLGIIGIGHTARSVDRGKDLTDEPISKGLRIVLDNPTRKDFQLRNIEVSYSVQDNLRDNDDIFIAGTDKLTLRISESGEFGTWSDKQEKPLNDTLQRILKGRLRFGGLGGLAQSHGFLCLILESNGLDALAIERVMVNV